MASFNKVILIGNLTRDPEANQTPSGSSVTNFCMAVNNKYKSKDGDTQEDALFIDVAVWGKQAGPCAEYLSKGSPCLVEGRLKMDKWEKEGQKHTKITVTAQSVQFLGTKEDRGEQAPAQDRAPQVSGSVGGEDPSERLPF